MIVKKNTNLLEVPNINSRDALVKKLIYRVEDDLFNRYFKSLSKSEYLCICSGGTTSNCARDGFITLDLRKEYNQIHLEEKSNLIKIGGVEHTTERGTYHENYRAHTEWTRI